MTLCSQFILAYKLHQWGVRNVCSTDTRNSYWRTNCIYVAAQHINQPTPRNSYWRTNCIRSHSGGELAELSRNSYWRTNCITSHTANIHADRRSQFILAYKLHRDIDVAVEGHWARNSYWRTNCIVNMAQCLPILNDNFMQFFLQYDNISNSYFALGRLYCHSATGFIYLFCANLHRKLWAFEVRTGKGCASIP